MLNADWIALAVLAVFALIGAVAGFGKGLKFFTSGVFGIVISVFVCYCVGGFILELQFVKDLLSKLAALWTDKGDNFFFDFLTKIRMEIIVYYVALFLVVQIVRKILVLILKNMVEIKFLPVQIINRILGMALFVGMAVLLALLAFQIIYWVGGTTAENVLATFEGSALKLDELFLNNPLNSIIEQIKNGLASI